ncbi:spermidine synthase [Orrella sp. JC864]|uniref:spermidine synthase n=1 Tax=Orrella sp. JC864 TaxID=3120298 RepID=UPI00300BC6AD
MRNKPASQHDEVTLSEHDGIRYLHFATEWVQGAMRIDKPAELVLEYTRQMMAWLLFLDPPREAAIGQLGLGAGSLTRFCLKHTDSPLQVVEWNPQVTLVCQWHMKLPAASRLVIDHEDAAVWVADPARQGQCPVLMVDLYDAQAQGPVRDSVQFYAHCRRVLGEVGVMTVNLFGNHDSFPRNLANLREAFDGRLALLPPIDAGNQIVLAFSGPPLQVSAEALLERAAQVEARYGLPARRWARSLIGAQRGQGLLDF